ncbi:MAG: T9SS type A sorting domain-containing protein [Candidatus Sabulitectum sp.]|nr:T9SS type A sorting domain-containing protein [Candidatus Sabulitectum sp.]
MNIHRRIIRWTGKAALAVILLAGPCLGGIWTNYSSASFVGGLDIQGNDLWAATSAGALLWDIAAQTYTKYTTIDGLADMNLKDVFIDNAGNIWFGCTEGVQCYDGSTWITYNTGNSPLPGNTVYSVIQDLDGAMWFGTNFGCAKFTDPNWEVFTNLGGGATDIAVRGMGVDSQNRIWTANNPSDYGDPGGVSMYNGTSWTRYDPSSSSIGQYFLSLTIDGNDNVWAGSWVNYVFVYDGSIWTNYDNSNSSLLGNNIEAFEVESDSILWISNHPASPTPSNSGVARYDGSWSILTPAGSGLPDPYVYAISNADGVTWFGTSIHGTAGYDGTTWDYLETINEPHTNYFTSVEYGSVGTSDVCLYFGTDHTGIAILNEGIWSSYQSASCGLGDNYINDLHIDDNILWAACQFTGVWQYDGSSWQNFNAGNSDLLGDIILSADTDTQGNIWFGTSGWTGPGGQDGAVSRFNGTTWTNYYLQNSGLIDDDNLNVSVGPGDTIWIGTEEGISKFDGSSNWTDYHTGNSGLIENHVVSISFDETGGKWFATQGGISHFSEGTWTSYTTADGLPANSVREICISDSGIVWAATDGGIAFYEESTGWTAYTQTDGLADDNVTCAGMGEGELVWLGTYRCGVSSFDRLGTGIFTPDPAETGTAGWILAFPNPFTSTVHIQYSLPVQEHVQISVFDMSGRIVKTLANETQQADQHSVYWDGTGQNGTQLSGGMYFYQISSNSITASGKLMLLR